MTIFDGRAGMTYEVTRLTLAADITRRLESLGILDGTRIDVLNKKKNGAVIIKARGARWALGKEFAEGIEVKEL